MKRQLAGSDVQDQLAQAKVLPWLQDVMVFPRWIRATAVRPDVLIHVLQHHDQFQQGIFYGLHPEVGEHPVDFRSFQDAFGRGSLQIVMDRETGNFYSDVDRFSPYADAVGFFGHAGEVITHWIKRWFT